MCNYPFLILDNRPVAIAKAVAKLFVPFKMKKKKHLNMEIIILVLWELLSFQWFNVIF